ncbi:MAG: pyridoxal-phosphate dependent enzyme [Deltaproteobacteria bacterium]|nr:pyridoxal-phosphate dependent enzyme [Deltaproteobacteria bacterium]
MQRCFNVDDLNPIPRLGLIAAASPVTALPELAQELGLDYLGVKRDDQIDAFHGGNKPRKLDYLLAVPPFSEARTWAALGAIGSGNMVALVAAAAHLDRRVEAHLFWEPISEGVIDNLAFVASGPAAIRFHLSRFTAVLRRPTLVLGSGSGDPAVLPVGSTSPRSTLGSIRAGLELADQIVAGELPVPDQLYLALGTGGTSVGIALGLAMAGLETEVIAVSVVERLFTTWSQMARLRSLVAAFVGQQGLDVAAHRATERFVIDRSQLGPGYAVVTPASQRACRRLADQGIPLEPIYTGKAMAGLLAAADRGQLRGKKVLFWNTRHGGPLPCHDAWRCKLPADLASRLARAAP